MKHNVFVLPKNNYTFNLYVRYNGIPIYYDTFYDVHYGIVKELGQYIFDHNVAPSDYSIDKTVLPNFEQDIVECDSFCPICDSGHTAYCPTSHIYIKECLECGHNWD